ncbi:MAG: helix-turn-helix transcriptional regulator [Janthinobacterium lividum]
MPLFLLAQGLLSIANWCAQPLASAGPAPVALPWYSELLLAPICYIYFRVLTTPHLHTPGAWRSLLPGLGQVGLFASVVILGLGARQGGLAASLGPPSAVTTTLAHVVGPLSLGCYLLFFFYGLRALDDHRRYALTCEPEGGWAQVSRQRSLLILLMLGFGLGLGFVTLDAWFGPVAYSATWYAFAVRGGLIFGLAVVGLQASYAVAAGPNRYQPPANRGVLPLLGTHAYPVLSALLPTAALPVEAPATLAAEPTPDLLRWRDRLVQLMEQAQPWREPDLTLHELAQRLGTHPALLSRVLNTACGQNFNDFVNTYRTQEAQRKLADPRFAHYSLMGVALESGFNSKSTFNRVFKKLTGQAPSEVTRPNL